ncbi:MAG: peptidase U32 family protein, partial [Prevotella fusca]
MYSSSPNIQHPSPSPQHPSPTTIELLAPAKNLGCGIAAIEHGADAVYIGASRFGARQSAGNSVEDIGKLCEYAHRYGATVHVTINTIIYNDEFEDTLALVRELVAVGVDAFLLQDMGLMSKVREIVPDTVALHASTQCDTRTWEKAEWLSQQGFDRVVLARELSAEEINGIHSRLPELELEAFVHGALCVSYSGVCYVSQYSFGRSANRGACAQFCRLAFDLKDSDGKTIEHQRHLLSLKDMSQIDSLETLMRSGACAFKIEGRLKDINYVKNVVSAYSKRIDEIIRKHPGEFRRASLGRVRYSFTPDLKKTFNRGYTNYFLKGRQADIFSPDTPKALGEFVGRVKEIRRDSFNVSSTANFANGDGLCFLSRDAEGLSTRLEGFRVNRAVGNRLYPFKMPRGLKPGMGLYRNQDQAFDKELSGKTAERKIAIKMWFGASPETSSNPSEEGECLTDSRGGIWAKAEVIGSSAPNQTS